MNQVNQFSELKTKKARVLFIKEKVKNDGRWLLKGLLTIYNLQTEEEKSTEATKEHNGIGFSGIDAEILSSFAKQILRRGIVYALENREEIDLARYLSPRQEAILRNKMQKYAGQLSRIANSRYPIVK